MDNRKCGPRISEAAADKLKNRYVLMRTGARDHEMETDKKTSIPITVRLDKQNCCNKILRLKLPLCVLFYLYLFLFKRKCNSRRRKIQIFW